MKQFTDPPVIIAGCPRSGTTLLLAILDAHPEIQAIPSETRIFKKWPFNMRLFNKWYHRYQINQYLKRQTIKPTAKRWAEKTPQNIQFLQPIFQEFREEVRIIHIIRDGRDVVTSVHPRYPDQYFVSPGQWAAIVQQGLKFRAHPQVFTLFFEDLVLRLEETMEKTAAFLDLTFHENWHAYSRHTNLKTPPTLQEPLAAVNPEKAGRWKKEQYKDRIQAFYTNKTAVDLLKKLNFEDR